jgi:hypothetical protein
MELVAQVVAVVMVCLEHMVEAVVVGLEVLAVLCLVPLAVRAQLF